MGTLPAGAGASPGGISGRSWRRGSEGHGAESTPSKGTEWDRGVCGKAARLRVVGSSPSRGEPPQAGGDLGPRSLETSQVTFLPWLCLSFTPMARGDHPPLEPMGEPGGYQPTNQPTHQKAASGGGGGARGGPAPACAQTWVSELPEARGRTLTATSMSLSACHALAPCPGRD